MVDYESESQNRNVDNKKDSGETVVFVIFEFVSVYEIAQGDTFSFQIKTKIILMSTTQLTKERELQTHIPREGHVQGG